MDLSLSSGIVKPLKTKSFFDKINPIAKILSYLVLIAIVFLGQNVFSILVIFLILFAFLLLIRAPWSIYWKAIKPMIFILPLTLLINIFVIEGDKVAFYLGAQAIYFRSFIVTLIIFLKLYLLILLSSVLILSLSETELTNGITTLLKPLRIFKIPTAEIALMISIALRYIPLLIYETKIILHALGSRGIDYYSGGLLEKFRAISNLINPLFVVSFMHGTELAQAMKSRGYQIGGKRTQYQVYKFYFKDCLYLFSFLVFLGVIITLVILNINFNDFYYEIPI